MNISAEILEHELCEKVVLKNIVYKQELMLEGIRFITPHRPMEFQMNQAYVCRADELPRGNMLPAGCCVLCMGIPESVAIEEYLHISILFVEMTNFAEFSNLLLNIFKKYNLLEKRLDDHFQMLSQIDDSTIDLIAELVKNPLCIMDANYNAFAFSQKLKPPGDKLWDYLEKGYGYHYYDIVCKSQPRLEEVAKAENGEIEMVNNISGRILRVKAIYVNNVPIAFLGMHAMQDTTQPFSPHTVQLFHFAVNYLQRRSNLLKRIQKSRGKKHEQFLEDLLSGKCQQNEDIPQCLNVVGIKPGDFYLIGMIYFNAETPMAYNHIAMMDYIENMFKTSRCVKFENYVIVLTSLNQEEVFERKIQICVSETLITLLNECNGKAIFSWPFESILDVPYVYAQLKEAKDMEIIKNNKETIIRYGAYSIALVMKQMQELHILGVLGSSAIRKLSYYDHVNNAELYLTLKMYLKNNCSISTTASAMHLHRNTLQYRLRQIETITDIDFDNANARARLLYAIDATDYLQGTYQ